MENRPSADEIERGIIELQRFGIHDVDLRLEALSINPPARLVNRFPREIDRSDSVTLAGQHRGNEPASAAVIEDANAGFMCLNPLSECGSGLAD